MPSQDARPMRHQRGLTNSLEPTHYARQNEQTDRSQRPIRPTVQAVGPNGRQTDRGGPDPTADPHRSEARSKSRQAASTSRRGGLGKRAPKSPKPAEEKAERPPPHRRPHQVGILKSRGGPTRMWTTSGFKERAQQSPTKQPPKGQHQNPQKGDTSLPGGFDISSRQARQAGSRNHLG